MGKLVVTQFWASVAYAPQVKTLANIKQKDYETLRVYLKCLNDKIPKYRKALDDSVKNFLIVGVRRVTNF